MGFCRPRGLMLGPSHSGHGGVAAGSLPHQFLQGSNSRLRTLRITKMAGEEERVWLSPYFPACDFGASSKRGRSPVRPLRMQTHSERFPQACCLLLSIAPTRRSRHIHGGELYAGAQRTSTCGMSPLSQPCCPINGTNRHPPRRSTWGPLLVLVKRTSVCSWRSPTGMTKRPPNFN
jgi:hypothetical protein